MKCFERLMKPFISSFFPPDFDPLQFAYRTNRSTGDAVAQVLHTTLSHLDEGCGNYVRMLFIDYSSAFNTIVPSTLTEKLQDLGFSTSLCRWIYSFLTARPQSVRIGDVYSQTLTLNIGAPQGCVLSLLLNSLYTADCTARYPTNSIVKFADDTVVVGLISRNDERAYRSEVDSLAKWCEANHLSMNIRKTKEMVIDLRRQRGEQTHTPIQINGSPVERVSNFKYLGVHITEDLTWNTHTDFLITKGRQRLYHLWRLKRFKIFRNIQRIFYTGIIESILCNNITVWYGNCTELFRLLRCGKRLCSLKTRTQRFRRSFYPQAV